MNGGRHRARRVEAVTGIPQGHPLPVRCDAASNGGDRRTHNAALLLRYLRCLLFDPASRRAPVPVLALVQPAPRQHPDVFNRIDPPQAIRHLLRQPPRDAELF